MRTAFLIVCQFLFLSLPSFCQFVTGTCLSNVGKHSKGEKIKVVGIKRLEGKDKRYYVEFSTGIHAVNAKKIKLDSEYLPFWKRIWLEERAESVYKTGRDIELRKEIEKYAKNYHKEVTENGFKYVDPVLYDYIYGLLHKIHPNQLIKTQDRELSLIIVKSTELDFFSLVNGTMVITTGLIASTNSETELIQILSKMVAGVVVEYDLINRKKAIQRAETAKAIGVIAGAAASIAVANNQIKKYGTYSTYDMVATGVFAGVLTADFVKAIGVKNKAWQDNKLIEISNRFMILNKDMASLTSSEYIKKIGNVLNLHAWIEYNDLNYLGALNFIRKLNKANAMIDADKVMLSKLTRKLNFRYTSREDIIEVLEEEKKMNPTCSIEVDFELGMLHLRADEFLDAKECFLNYRFSLLELEKKGIVVQKELSDINLILSRSF